MLDEKPTDEQRLDSLISQSRALDSTRMNYDTAAKAEVDAKRCYDKAVIERERLQKQLEQQRERIRRLAKEL